MLLVYDVLVDLLIKQPCFRFMELLPCLNKESRALSEKLIGKGRRAVRQTRGLVVGQIPTFLRMIPCDRMLVKEILGIAENAPLNEGLLHEKVDTLCHKGENYEVLVELCRHLLTRGIHNKPGLDFGNAVFLDSFYRCILMSEKLERLRDCRELWELLNGQPAGRKLLLEKHGIDPTMFLGCVQKPSVFQNELYEQWKYECEIQLQAVCSISLSIARDSCIWFYSYGTRLSNYGGNIVCSIKTLFQAIQAEVV